MTRNKGLLGSPPIIQHWCVYSSVPKDDLTFLLISSFPILPKCIQISVGIICEVSSPILFLKHIFSCICSSRQKVSLWLQSLSRRTRHLSVTSGSTLTPDPCSFPGRIITFELQSRLWLLFSPWMACGYEPIHPENFLSPRLQ